MQGRLLAAAGSLFLASACAVAPIETEPMPAAPAPPPPATADAITVGTHLQVRLPEDIGIDTNEVGDRFAMVVEEALVAGNGEVIVPEGAVIGGQITGLGTEDRDIAAVRIHFDVLQMNGQTYPFEADVVHTRLPSRRLAERAVIGAVTGAAAGATLGSIIRRGELEAVLVGGALGAGAGTIIALGTAADGRARLPAGTVLTLAATQQVALR
jgi:hypothetical protein